MPPVVVSNSFGPLTDRDENATDPSHAPSGFSDDHFSLPDLFEERYPVDVPDYSGYATSDCYSEASGNLLSHSSNPGHAQVSIKETADRMEKRATGTAPLQANAPQAPASASTACKSESLLSAINAMSDIPSIEKALMAECGKSTADEAVMKLLCSKLASLQYGK